MKIAYCIEAFYNCGGMERVVSVKANWLAEHGYDVTLLIASQRGESTAFALSPSIKLIDLQCRLHNMKSGYKMALEHHLQTNTYDIVISTGGLELLFLWKFKDKSHKMVEFHFAWNRFFRMSNKVIDRIKAVWQTVRQIRCAAKYERAVMLTHTDKQFYQWFMNNTFVIPNPVTIKAGHISDCTRKEAIAIGRLNYQKGFDLLIQSWKIVADKHPDWRLNIYGDGQQRDYLENLIKKEGLSGIASLNGRTYDIGSKIAESSIHICSSRYEGFSLVIIETASYGVPSVAFNCIAGPSELIKDGVNGILIHNVGDIKKLANGICQLIENSALRKSMSIEAREMSRLFDIDKIMPRWEHLFNEINNSRYADS